jgi:choline dehydrogenase
MVPAARITSRVARTVSTAGLAAGLSGAAVEHALAAGENQTINQAQLKGAYDYIVIGGGASGSIIAGELSKTGADVLIVESGGADTGPTISNPSIWFYNVGGPLDWKLPIAPVPQLNNRKFNMALGHVLGGGSSINAMVWSRGMENDYDTWERNGATGWAFKDVLPMFKAQEDWEGGANRWRGIGGAVHIRKPGDPHPTAPAFLEAARQMGFPIVDDVNGPMRAGAGYINMNIAADGSRVSSARAFLRPNLARSNLTLLLNTDATKVLFDGDRASGIEIVNGETARTVRAIYGRNSMHFAGSPGKAIRVDQVDKLIVGNQTFRRFRLPARHHPPTLAMLCPASQIASARNMSSARSHRSKTPHSPSSEESHGDHDRSQRNIPKNQYRA